MKILFISGEVSPFTAATPNADLIRKLPEWLNDTGNYEIRIVMPRYGTINERKNRLHEVIRLSSKTPVTVGERSEPFTVKVASIPGIRLQVYFVDNNYYFKRKGIFADKDGGVFNDNEERAWFFSQAALETTRNLGWKPDVIYVNGWIASLVPMLVRTRFAEDALFEQSKIIYTPDEIPVKVHFTPGHLAAFGITEDRFANIPLDQAGTFYADSVAHLNSEADYAQTDSDTQWVFAEEKEDIMAQMLQTFAKLQNVEVL
jgi:starch synthase